MRVVLSERVEAELEHHFAYGVEKFGRLIAERTFSRSWPSSITHKIENPSGEAISGAPNATERHRLIPPLL
jgi:hypothetical protein